MKKKHHRHHHDWTTHPGTSFSVIYNRFLEKVTDDMYLVLTPQDTMRDLQNLLIDAIPGFEFPRVNLRDYIIDTKIKQDDEIIDSDFILGVVWGELDEENTNNSPQGVLIENSAFRAILTDEEINILALLMKQGWIQRQVSSIEVTRMKYSGADFKMTSQANHLAKLLTLLSEAQRESFHMQRLYKRRKLGRDGRYRSNWRVLRERSALDEVPSYRYRR